MAEDSKTRAVTDANFGAEVLQSQTPVLVDFWAPWCGPCRTIAPIVEAIAQEYVGRMSVVKMNIDDNPGTPQRYQVMGIPTLILFKGGEPAERFVGYLPKEDLQRRVDAVL